jgi:hypothetical protein
MIWNWSGNLNFVTNSKLTELSSVKVESYLGLKSGNLTDLHYV